MGFRKEKRPESAPQFKATGTPGFVGDGSGLTGSFPAAITTTFGGGAGAFTEEGNISRQISGTGINPGAIGADNVLAVYSIPASSFDVAGRGLLFTVQGSFANNGNSKRVKIIFNPATAVVGSTVGGGGTTLSDTGAFNTAALTGWLLQAQVFKYGAAASNTQLGIPTAVVLGAAHGGIGAGAAGVPVALTATENAAILVAVVGNATTVATDIALNFFEINAMN